jgi:hypothetical protein
MPLIKSLFIILLSCFATGCQSGPGISTAVEMKSSLDAEIPVGTPIAVAASRLKARGFDVHEVTRSDLTTTEPADVLYAEMTERGIIICKWKVSIFAMKSAVAKIDVVQ